VSGGGKRWDGNVGGGGEVVVRMRLPNWGMDWICRDGRSEALRVRGTRLGRLERQKCEIGIWSGCEGWCGWATEVFWKGLDEVMEWVYGVACQGVLGRCAGEEHRHLSRR
jgi:hypothetical protein